jgi:hypothetical protein
VLEMGTLGLTWRGLETGYGSASEALPEETGSQRIGRTYGAWRQSSTLLLGEAMETSASSEARSAPLPYPTNYGGAWRVPVSHSVCA